VLAYRDSPATSTGPARPGWLPQSPTPDWPLNRGRGTLVRKRLPLALASRVGLDAAAVRAPRRAALAAGPPGVPPPGSRAIGDLAPDAAAGPPGVPPPGSRAISEVAPDAVAGGLAQTPNDPLRATVTKGHSPASAPPGRRSFVFGRYSERAQRVIILAQDEARRLNYR